MKKNLEILISRLIRYIIHLDRIAILWYMLVAWIGIILVTTFGYTVLDHTYFARAAEKQQKATIKNPVSRGNILSSNVSLHGILGVSTNLGTLAIDPTQSGSMTRLLPFLSDIVYRDSCEGRLMVDCIVGIGNYTRIDLTGEKGLSEEKLKDQIEAYIQTRISTPIESILIKEALDESTITQITDIGEPALFFVVNNLYVNPTKVTNSGALASRLSTILGVSSDSLEPLFVVRKRRHLEILRKMNIISRDIIKKRIDIEKAALNNIPTKDHAREIWTLDNAVFPFLKIEDNLVRYYPEGQALGQITGYVDTEGKGRYGIEGYFEDDLQGESPIQYITKDIQGRPIRDYASSGSMILKNGIDVTLTVDRNIQKEISKRLESAVTRFRANRGSVVVMDPTTGAVIAMVNYPNYDPNNYTNVYDMEPVLYVNYPNPSIDLFGYPLFIVDSGSGSTLSTNIDGKRIKMRSATEDEVANFAITKYKFKNGFGVGNYKNDVVGSLYEPGSVFKAVTVAIGLDTGEIHPDDRYYDRGYVELDLGGGIKQRISNIAHQCLGNNTYSNAVNWSCNVGMINIIEKIGRSLFSRYVSDFGFGQKTNITIDGEVFSQISNYEKWSRIQFFTMSFGQGINATLLQMAAAYSVLANGGVYMQPYIVERIAYPNGKIIDSVPTPVRRVIKEETSKTITAMLVDSVKYGFAKRGGVAGYLIAGKTGTSQIPYRGTYENIYFKQDIGHTITSYGGYAPAYNPKFVLMVSIERPRTGIYSETTSSALFSEIAEYLLGYYKIPKNK
ncbi:penicillin-binding protein 2 [Candidatus Gracilibacteria bacterium]|nr:penicillin-binding protein 2 [Candidatus Gracilibacteria bacterium]